MCKISGLWTQAGGKTDNATIKPYIEHVLSCFGASRLMWGSDWPVLNLAGDYSDWYQQARALCADLSDDETAHIFGLTAQKILPFMMMGRG